MKIITLVILSSLLGFNVIGQIYIEPVIGYQIDLNNNNRFKQINSAVQGTFKLNMHYELVVQLQKTWPIQSVSYDSSFTLSPALPLYAVAKKTISTSSFSISIGNRFPFLRTKTGNIFSILLYAGFTFQQYIVKYEYDKSNYILLNPDKSFDADGLFVSGGVEYMRQLKKGRFFVQVLVSSPPARKDIEYPSSFYFMAPLSFNAGYSILIKKNNHEK